MQLGIGGHKPRLTSAVFDPSGRYVLTAGTDGTVRRAECAVCGNLEGMLELARAQLAGSRRPLTEEERERYRARLTNEGEFAQPAEAMYPSSIPRGDLSVGKWTGAEPSSGSTTRSVRVSVAKSSTHPTIPWSSGKVPI